MDDQAFLFDDFFVDESDPGVEHVVTIRGRAVPIKLKRGITLADKEAVLAAAVRRHVNAKGQVVVDGYDDAAATRGLLARCILSWPFTYRDGSPVPINEANISKLLSDVTDQLAAALAGAAQALRGQADGPFVAASAPASVEAATVASTSTQADSASE